MTVTSPSNPVILQVLPHMGAGGVPRGVIDIASAVVDSGWTALVASEGGHGVHELKRVGGKHIQMPLASKNPVTIYRNIQRLRRLFVDERVSLIHARSRAPAWSGYYAARASDIPFVTTFHGTYGHKGKLKRRYNDVMTRGNAVIAISEHIARHIETVYGVNDKRVRIVYRGIDTELFEPGSVSSERVIALAKQWRLTEPIPVVMMSGRLTRWKGQQVLIEALSILGREDIRCLFIGDDQGRGGYRRDLDALVKKLNLSNTVHFPGHCRDMAAAYMLADVVVSASTEPEAFGRVMVEAQAMGKPVVVSNHGASTELIIEGETGWSFVPGDPKSLAKALKTVLSLSEKQREGLAHKAISHVTAHFTVAHMQQQTMSTYREVLQMDPLG